MKMDRDKIKERYLGPEKDIERFFNATDAFHKALLKGLSYSPSHSRKEILSYLDANVEPAYIEVEDSLKTIIAFANGKMRKIEEQSSFTVNTGDGRFPFPRPRCPDRGVLFLPASKKGRTGHRIPGKAVRYPVQQYR